eukprot:14279-Heterococcus_DN1.PRE.7
MQVLALSDSACNCAMMMQHCNCLPIVAALLLQACCTHAFLASAPIHTRSLQYAARCTMSSSSEPQEQSTGVSRRDLFSGLVATGVAAAVLVSPPSAEAIGPVNIRLTNPTYAQYTCPPKTQIPGQKAGAGLRPVCVKVTAQADNPSKKEVRDPAIFGRVFDEDGTSVVANNPDGGTDAGQFAIIEGVVAPGKSQLQSGRTKTLKRKHLASLAISKLSAIQQRCDSTTIENTRSYSQLVVATLMDSSVQINTIRSRQAQCTQKTVVMHGVMLMLDVRATSSV